MAAKATSKAPKGKAPDKGGKPIPPHRLLVSPAAQAAVGVMSWSEHFGEPDLAELLVTLRERAQAVKAGDLSEVEAMLLGQAEVLQSMFVMLTRKAARQEYLAQFQTYATLALKAQAQSRATLTALADIKLPRPVAFVGQANISNGPQQVNNGAAPARAGNLATERNGLLGADDGGERMDKRAAIPAGAGNPPLETLDAGDRSAHRRG